VQLPGEADRRQRLILPALEIRRVGTDLGAVRIDLLTGRGPRALHAGDAASVGDHRRIGHLDDVDVVRLGVGDLS
jgi:hypothetical protein